jgi:hypothetical protein
VFPRYFSNFDNNPSERPTVNREELISNFIQEKKDTEYSGGGSRARQGT